MLDRGVVSTKQHLISVLEQAYAKALSEADFYKRLRNTNITLYSRSNSIAGVILNRKFRFKTLGYDKGVLKRLDKKLTHNKRLNILKGIKKKQKKNDKVYGKGRMRMK